MTGPVLQILGKGRMVHAIAYYEDRYQSLHGKRDLLRAYRRMMSRRAFRRTRGYLKGIEAWR